MKHIGKIAATLAAAVSLLAAGCSVTTNPDILYAINPPPHQLQLSFNGNAYADGAAVTMTKTLKSAGDKEAFTLKNISSSSGLTVNSVTVDDATHFILSGFAADTAIDPTSSSVFYVAFNDAPAAAETLATTMRISYKIDGRSRTQTLTLRATREVNAAKIAVKESSADAAIANNDVTPYEFGTAASGPIDKTFVITNSGTTPLVLTAVTSNNDTAFVITANPQGKTIAAGASDYLVIRRTDASTASTATIAIISNASDFPTFKINVKSSSVSPANAAGLIALTDGEGTAIASNDTAAYDFGYSADAATIEKTFMIKNIGTKAITFTTIESNNVDTFRVTASPAGISLAPGATQMLNIQRTNAKVAASATITINSDAGNYAAFKLNVKSQDKQTGNLLVVDDGGSSVTMSTSAYFDLGYVTSGGLTRTFTIKNAGTGNLSVISVVSGNEGSISISNDHASGSVLSSGQGATFSLNQPNPAITASAKITITTDSGASSFYVTGGGSSIPVSVSNSFAYLLSGVGYDFTSSVGTKSVVLTNTGSAPVEITSSSLESGSTFTDNTAYPLRIPAGGQGSLSISYATSGATSSDTAAYKFTDKYHRTYAITFTGTGYKQPTDLADIPTLWLRADRIPASSTVQGTPTRISSWIDCRNNGLSADAVTAANGTVLRPAYNSAGINNLPSVTFSGTSGTDCLKVYKDGGFINTSTGTTTFIVFRTTTIDGSRYIIQSLNTNSTVGVFPYLYIDPRYMDYSDGYYSWTGGADQPNLIYTFATYANTAGTRWVINDDLASKNTANLVQGGTTYAANLTFNTAPMQPDPNMFVSINGTQKAIGYLYSQTYTSHPYSDTSGNTKWGAYGYPLGTGTGAINPKITSLAATNADDYAFWLKAASTNHTYFYNRGDTTYNTNIASMFIGAASSYGGNFRGEIAEIIMYSSPITDTAKLNLIMNYLKNKYNY